MSLNFEQLLTCIEKTSLIVRIRAKPRARWDITGKDEMKKGFIIIALLLSIMVSAFGNNGNGRPRWISEVPVASNNTFEYKVIVIHASNSSEARALVPREITHYVETSHNVHITSVSKIASESNNGNLSEQTSFNMMAVVEGDPVNVVVKIIDEYQETDKGRDVYYFLCA